MRTKELWNNCFSLKVKFKFKCKALEKRCQMKFQGNQYKNKGVSSKKVTYNIRWQNDWHFIGETGNLRLQNEKSL